MSNRADRSSPWRLVSLCVLLGLSREPLPAGVQPVGAAPSRQTHVDVGGVGGVLVGAAEVQDAIRPAWRRDELMLAVTPGEDAAQIAAAHGLSLRRAMGSRGLASVRVPEGADLEASRAALLGDDRVISVDRVGAIYGSSGASGRSTSTSSGGKSGKVTVSGYRGLQWHLDAVRAPNGVVSSSVVVAVLDTGVAYETYSDAQGSYARAESLASTSFVAPYDFVNDDAHPNDDHHHGTHMVSLIASNGAVSGVAPGVSILPVKILDADNSGSELDLIDAIDHAVANGADIINMSLVFSEGYAASQPLIEALQAAHDAGVFLVGALGNDGDVLGHYPAASPLVFGVSASALHAARRSVPSAYTDYGATADVLAPGGDLSEDANGDGYPDGLLAETIYPGDPSRVGYWMYTGSSQASALVAGAAARLVAAGVSSPAEIAAALQVGADDSTYGLDAGYGGGLLDVTASLSVDLAESAAAGALDPVYVSALPYLAQGTPSGTTVRPTALVTALDADGEPLVGATVYVTSWGSGGESFTSCVTDVDGECTAEGPEVKVSCADEALGFGLAVDAVRLDGRAEIARPSGVIFMTDGLHLVTEALDAAGLLDSTLLAWRWEAGTDDVLGPMVDAYMLTDLSAGAASRPIAALFTPAALAEAGTIEESSLDLDAAGLFSDTLGLTSIQLITLKGSGLFSDTLGLTSGSLTVLKAAGLFSDTLGLRALDVYSWSGWTVSGAGLFSDTLGFTGAPISLGQASLLGSGTLDGTALGSLLDSGGWMDADGQTLPGLLAGGADAGLSVASQSDGQEL